MLAMHMPIISLCSFNYGNTSLEGFTDDNHDQLSELSQQLPRRNHVVSALRSINNCTLIILG